MEIVNFLYHAIGAQTKGAMYSVIGSLMSMEIVKLLHHAIGAQTMGAVYSAIGSNSLLKMGMPIAHKKIEAKQRPNQKIMGIMTYNIGKALRSQLPLLPKICFRQALKPCIFRFGKGQTTVQCVANPVLLNYSRQC
jgi:hypothetical protein